MNKNIEQIKRKILPILKKRGVVRSSLFGSIVEGKMRKRSDVDILIKPKGEFSLFDLVDLQDELKKILKKKVDLLTYDSIHPRLKDIIEKHQVRIL